MRQYFGKYRGTVVNNVDPLLQGRIQVSVPAVHGEIGLAWALPCAPYAGPGVGFFAIPPLNANVWVEFEGGRSESPIWVGGFWGTGETPDPLALAATKIFKTSNVTLKLDDTPGVGGCTIQVGLPGAGPSIQLSATGVEITFGKNKVALSAASVSVNDGALEVI